MTDGRKPTVPAARYLQNVIKDTSYPIICDHGDKTELHEIVTQLGEKYEPPYRPKKLAQIDIAVVEPKSEVIFSLVEFEDTSFNTKTLIGDLIAPQIASGIPIGINSN